jgi:hypothetical protein
MQNTHIPPYFDHHSKTLPELTRFTVTYIVEINFTPYNFSDPYTGFTPSGTLHSYKTVYIVPTVLPLMTQLVDSIQLGADRNENYYYYSTAYGCRLSQPFIVLQISTELFGEAQK